MQVESIGAIRNGDILWAFSEPISRKVPTLDTIKITVELPLNETLARNTHRDRLKRAWRIDAGRVRVQSFNKAEARAEATRQLQQFINEWSLPTTVRFKDALAVLTLEPTERINEIAFYMVSTGSFPDGERYVHNSHESAMNWTDAKRRALYRLVANWVDFHDDASVAEGAAVLDDENAYELRQAAGWQRAYRHAADNGERDPHRWAGDNSQDFIPAA